MMSLPGEQKEVRMQGGGGYALEIPPEKARIFESSGGIKGSSAARITYKECLKNHAANIGGNVTDGCGEFMPSGEEGTLEALKCAACNCHRNFHRKEPASATAMVHPLHFPAPIPSAPMIHHHIGGAHWNPMAQPVKIAFPGGGGGSGGTDSSSEELNFNTFNSTPVTPPPPHMATKKRFRTKFTAEQKEKMQEFAEKLGWRIPREDDSEVQRFCAEVGVKRQVFKVWMHNNKSSSSSASATKKISQES